MDERKQAIEKAKASYELLKKEKEELINLRIKLESSIQKLEQDKKVKTYLELKKKLEQQEEAPSDNELMTISFWDMDRKLLDKIYFYEGAYIQAKENQDMDQFTGHIELADYVMYRNIADFRDYRRISIARKTNFEKKNIVIKTLVPSKQISTKIYDELVNYYFELLLTTDDNEKDIAKKLKQKARKL